MLEIPKIRVCIRKRPRSKKEINKQDQDIVQVTSANNICVNEVKFKVDLTKYDEVSSFNFDNTFHEDCDNSNIYLDVVRPLVYSAFRRENVTCFAYGQTGSGKTYTMMGANDAQGYPIVPGLYLLATQDIFNLLQQPQFTNYSIFLSFFEIYCGKVFDLLNDRQILQLREDHKSNINVIGSTQVETQNLQSVMNLINKGMSVRVTGKIFKLDNTGQNDESSRSHAILQFQIKDQSQKNYGKISFIDLAGSERGADVSDQSKQTRLDGAEINKSLLALKECIRALDLDKYHLPFRGSKLTLVLRDSFIGNCKTVMIGNINPCSTAAEQTLNTLRYAERVKSYNKNNYNQKKDKNEFFVKNTNQSQKNLHKHKKQNVSHHIQDQSNNHIKDILNQPTDFLFNKPQPQPQPQLKISKQNSIHNILQENINEQIQNPQIPIPQEYPTNILQNFFNKESSQDLFQKNQPLLQNIPFEKPQNLFGDVKVIQKNHQQVVDQILQSEENLISLHKTQLKEQKQLFHEVKSIFRRLVFYNKLINRILIQRIIQIL